MSPMVLEAVAEKKRAGPEGTGGITPALSLLLDDDTDNIVPSPIHGEESLGLERGDRPFVQDSYLCFLKSRK